MKKYITKIMEVKVITKPKNGGRIKQETYTLPLKVLNDRWRRDGDFTNTAYSKSA